MKFPRNCDSGNCIAIPSYEISYETSQETCLSRAFLVVGANCEAPKGVIREQGERGEIRREQGEREKFRKEQGDQNLLCGSREQENLHQNHDV